MPKRITSEKKTRYINSGSSECPFCESEKLRKEEIEIFGIDAIRVVYCPNCEEQWEEYWTLKTIKL